MWNEMVSYFKQFFKEYAEFEGVVDRRRFWITALDLFIISIALGFVTGIIALVPFIGWIISLLVNWAWNLGILVPSLGISVRRLRDAGYHWAWLFLCLTGIGGIVVIVFWCMPSVKAAAKVEPVVEVKAEEPAEEKTEE